VQEVHPLVANLGVELRQLPPDPLPVAGPLLLAGEFPLGSLEPFFRFLRCLGFSMMLPSERAANFSSPTSKPTAGPVCVCCRESSISTAKTAHHLPAASRLMITVLMMPGISRCSFIFTSPIFDSFSLPSWKEAPFPFPNWV